MKEADRCKSVCDGDQCEKLNGHKGKHGSFHDSEGNLQKSTWTDAGAARDRETQNREARNKLSQF